ncbi:MAG: flagellar motor switch protein FliN, partial [Actinobacteria bacterium]|nr:flagellar motor switch protein FliN [Actinomycetota bacterium]
AHSIEFFNDLELEISIELGRTTMVLKDILKLSNGSVVELDKFASEFVDVYVNNKKFAEGQVVVVDQNFAVRITNLISSDEKLASVAN